MKTRNFVAPVVLACSLGACDYNLPNPNGPSIAGLQTGPTQTTIGQAAVGLLIGLRVTSTVYASLLGQLGRESYNLDPSQGPTLLSNLVGPFAPSGFIDFGWAAEYRNIRATNVVLHSLDAVGPAMSEKDKEAVRGYAKTIQALGLLNVLRVRDDVGVAIDVDIDITSVPPIAPKAQVYARILQLLDEGKTSLGNADAKFPFAMPTGFADFNTPANFIKFNRAIRARANVYSATANPAGPRDVGKYTAALTDLQGSFISANPADLPRGAYHTFSTASGDVQNTLFDPTGRALLAHPSIAPDAQKRADGTVDLRVQKKVAKITPAKILEGESSDLRFTIYNSPSDPVPVIKDEELILMRAEANWFTGNKQAAIDDLNLVRTASGGLVPLTLAALDSDAKFIDNLLYERRYSLLFEHGHRWIDARRFNRLATLPRDVAGRDKVFPYAPLTSDECIARNNIPAIGCTQVTGT